jgi:cytochrome o ubiquinol oxidase subunit 1
MFGKLSWDAVPTDEPIVMYTLAIVGLMGFALVGSITWKRKWGYIWREWFTSVDHKKIG